MTINSDEWLKQTDYDIGTAEYMFNGGKYFYAVFMCHLSIEKALKGLYQKKLGIIPPKVHNLIYLLIKINITPPKNIAKFIIKLNEASVATRYPEDIQKLQKDYTQESVKDIILKSKEIIEWIKNQY